MFSFLNFISLLLEYHVGYYYYLLIAMYMDDVFWHKTLDFMLYLKSSEIFQIMRENNKFYIKYSYETIVIFIQYYAVLHQAPILCY